MATVLVLEPEEEIRELLLRQLARMGHHGIPRSDGHEVDAVIVEPADADSLAHAHKLREERPTLPIVCASTDDDRSAARALSAAAFLMKPFGFEQLQRALEDALRSASSTA